MAIREVVLHFVPFSVMAATPSLWLDPDGRGVECNHANIFPLNGLPIEMKRIRPQVLFESEAMAR